MSLLTKLGTGRGAYYVLSDLAKSVLPKEQQSSELNDKPIELNDKPIELNEKIQALGKKANPQELAEVILTLCRLSPMTLAQLQDHTQRKKTALRQILGELIKQNQLKYLYEDNPTHPAQAYISTQTDDGESNEILRK